MKNLIKEIDLAPSKKIYNSIIADYGINTGICELIDNVIDNYVINNLSSVNIDVILNFEQQSITVSDNSGGIKESDIGNLISPGASGNSSNEQIIGIFGVGSKRAMVALAEDIKIKTRTNNKTFLIEYDKYWLMSPNWSLPYYEITNIEKGKTIIEMSKLRIEINQDIFDSLFDSLSEIYGEILNNNNININLNGNKIKGKLFNEFSIIEFNQINYSPIGLKSQFKIDGEEVSFKIIEGLKGKISSSGEYGVYFYCNNRLISKEVKDPEVGYISGKAGLDHPSASLGQFLIYLNGPAYLMPWNSSKSGINYSHVTFKQISKIVVDLVTNYTKISRKIVSGKNYKSNPYKIENIGFKEISINDKINSYILQIPINHRNKIPDLKEINSNIINKNNRTKGIIESIMAVDLILKQNFDQKNRICLILLDSTIEISFKEYFLYTIAVKNNIGTSKQEQVLKNRADLEKEIKDCGKLTNSHLTKIKYFYKLRCDLVHSKSNMSVTTNDIEDFRKLISIILYKFFKLNI